MELEGEINVDSTWRQVVYISIINKFKDLNTASYHFLIAEVPLDSNGRFKVEINGLPEQDHLYRVHICPEGDPISTIIVGGQSENFLHFIANARSHIMITGGNGKFVSMNTNVRGHPANASLSQLFKWKNMLHTTPSLATGQNRARMQNEIKNNLLQMMDTSSFSLVRLMALFYFDELEDSPPLSIYREQMEKLLVSDSSPYANHFRDRLEYLAFQNNENKRGKTSFTSGLLTGIVVILFLSVFFYFNHQRGQFWNLQDDMQNAYDLHKLSSQERRVWDLLKERRSNKEIASMLNIEVTTVKSHVYRIYNKMGIKSRKELWG
jgi:DNA-binding CsgD family transcriptional regulator